MEDFINRFIKTSYKIKGGRKFKNDMIYCFVSENNKWGVMKMNESNIYEELLPPIYESTGYEMTQDLIVGVNYSYGKFTLGANSYYLFRLNGEPIATIENIDKIIFEDNHNILVVKNRKYGVLNEKFQIEVPCEYHLLISLSKEILAFEKLNLDEPEKNKEDYENACGIINRKNEIIGSFYFTFRVYPHLYRDTVIVGTDDSLLIEREFFAFNIDSKVKMPLPFEKIFDTHSYHYHFKSQPLFRTVTEIVSGFVNFPMDTWDTDSFIVGKWGVAFPNGDVAIPNKYGYIERISGDYYKFCVGIPVIEENIEEEKIYLKQTKWGLIHINNIIVLEAQFDWIEINEERCVIITNKGGTVIWDENEHRPEWEIHGGINEELNLDRLPLTEHLQ